jgi:hypothetical protein
LTTISLTPASATINTGATQQFTASARDQFATALTTQPSFSWTVGGGGTISTAGLFTAGTTAGTYTVTAASGGKSGTAGITVTAASTTLLTNAGFETGATAPWRLTGGSVAGTIVSADKHTGTYSAKYSGTASWTGYAEQVVASCPAGTYTLKVWVKGSGTYSYCELVLKDGATNLATKTYTPNATWTQYSVTYTTTATKNLSATIWIQGNAGAVAYFDDFELVKQ